MASVMSHEPSVTSALFYSYPYCDTRDSACRIRFLLTPPLTTSRPTPALHSWEPPARQPPSPWILKLLEKATLTLLKQKPGNSASLLGSLFFLALQAVGLRSSVASVLVLAGHQAACVPAVTPASQAPKPSRLPQAGSLPVSH